MGDHWKSLADKLGAPGMDEPTPVEAASTPESDAPHELPQASLPAAPVEARREIAPAPETHSAKPKKKSSWEALASIFNIRVEPEPLPPEPLVPEPVDDVAETRSSDSFTVAFKQEPKPHDKQLHVFQENRQDRSNPALEQMFADAPRGDLDSWKKSPRVIDDLGWDDDAPKSRDAAQPVRERAKEEEILADSDSNESAESVVSEGDERRPRRRRRRRGPRRPESETTADVISEEVVDEIISIESGDEWAEPETFEVDASAEVADAVDPERRSSRRRRRGRKRPSDDTVAEPRSENDRRPVDRSIQRGERIERSELTLENTEPAERSTERDAEERPRRRPERRTEGDRADRTDRDRTDRDRTDRDRTERVRTEPRERPVRAERSEVDRPERQPRVHQERPLPPRADADETDDTDELDDSEASAIKHRNIPTWEDSLQSIIEANIANHSRNDSRGGPPRGRPRGRGGR